MNKLSMLETPKSTPQTREICKEISRQLQISDATLEAKALCEEISRQMHSTLTHICATLERE